MPKISVKRFVELLQKSKLLSETQLKDALVRYRAEIDEPLADTDFVVTRMIEDGLITQWQAGKLLNERHRGFYLGKYKLLGHLGTGGMSTVYLAEHNIMRQRRAIKVLPRKRVADKTYLERFFLEARAIASLNHPNIARAYDIDQDGDVHYIVMEYVDGKELSDMVKEDGPLDYRQAAEYVAQAADGLEHAHQQGLVHRDIKPANLLYDQRNDVVKVLDLGLALFKEEEYSLTVAFDEKILGTADYLAPEQARDSHDVDHRADVYGLGCALYYMLTGQPPFPEGTLTQRILNHQTKEPQRITEFRDDCPKELLLICETMMRKDPDQRIQTCREVSAVMQAWLEGKPLPKLVQAAAPVAAKGSAVATGNAAVGGTGGSDPSQVAIDTGDSGSRSTGSVVRGNDFKRKFGPKKDTPRVSPADQESVKSSGDDTFPNIVTRNDSVKSSGVLSGEHNMQAATSSGKISLSDSKLNDLIASGSAKISGISQKIQKKKTIQLPIWGWVALGSLISALITATVVAIIFATMR